jgi:Protein of unknown function (DUF3105)
LAKERKPSADATRSAARPGAGGRGRTRPPTQVVAAAQRRPWGLIVGAIAVVVFAAGVLTYAFVQVNKANAGKVSSVDEISGIQTFDYAAGQEHVTTPVKYEQSPPVGGPHDGEWADCTGTVYDVDIRHENAVHSLEHGAVWIAYDPDRVKGADVDTLRKLVDGQSGRMLSPYAGLDSAVSIQSWNHQLKVDSVNDERLKQFADFLTQNAKFYPEVGASCENPDFITAPLKVGDSSRGSRAMATDAPTTPTPAPGSGTP